MGERRGVYGFWWGNLREKDHLEDTRGWEYTIRMELKELGGHGLDSCGLGQGEMAATCKCNDKSSGSIKCGNFLTS